MNPVPEDLNEDLVSDIRKEIHYNGIDGLENCLLTAFEEMEDEAELSVDWFVNSLISGLQQKLKKIPNKHNHLS